MAPSPPLPVSAIPQSSTVIQLSWRPGFDGHSAITGYKLEMKRESGAYSVLEENISVTSYTKRNLDPYTTYTFRISARNAVGLSPGVTVANQTLQDGEWVYISSVKSLGKTKLSHFSGIDMRPSRNDMRHIERHTRNINEIRLSTELDVTLEKRDATYETIYETPLSINDVRRGKKCRASNVERGISRIELRLANSDKEHCSLSFNTVDLFACT